MQSKGADALNFLAGEWQSADISYPGGDEPPAYSHGTAIYHWGVGGKWMLYLFKTELPGVGPYEVHGGLGFDQGSDKYQAFAVNSLGLLMAYDGEWESKDTLVFSMVHPIVQPDTRVSYIRLPDDRVRMTSERSAEGGGREMYFETVLER